MYLLTVLLLQLLTFYTQFIKSCKIEVLTAVLLKIQVFCDMALSMGKWFPMFQSTVVSSSLVSTESRRSRPLDSKNEDAAHCHMPDLNFNIKPEKRFLFVLVGHV